MTEIQFSVPAGRAGGADGKRTSASAPAWVGIEGFILPRASPKEVRARLPPRPLISTPTLVVANMGWGPWRRSAGARSTRHPPPHALVATGVYHCAGRRAAQGGVQIMPIRVAHLARTSSLRAAARVDRRAPRLRAPTRCAVAREILGIENDVPARLQPPAAARAKRPISMTPPAWRDHLLPPISFGMRPVGDLDRA